MLADPVSFQNAVFERLVKGQWESDPLDTVQRQRVLGVLARWIAQADAGEGDGEARLMQARLPLRRLATACGVLPSNLLGYALGMDEAFDLFSLSGEQRRKLALLGDATFYRGFTLGQWAAREPRLALLFAAAAVDDSALDHSHADAMRRLISDVPALPPVSLPPVALNLLHRACFMLGYQPSALRYQAKAQLAQQASRLLALLKPPAMASAAPHPARTRPRLLVIAEKLVPNHALYRFFADLIGQLRSHFEVVLYTDEDTKCAAHAALSDRQYYFAPDAAPVAGWCRDIQALQPDLIFYPSIGMSMLTFALSLLRLAPLQVASSGHPSPSGSREIDATLLFDGLPKPAPGEFPDPIYYHQHRFLPAGAAVAPRAPAHAEVRTNMRTICINAMAAKLNADFLDLVQAIRASCGVSTRLLMFPNVHGVEHQGLQARLTALLGDVEVVPSSGHAAYIERLAQADVILQSFPFGGANTTIDGLELGIPVVCLRGDSLSGRIDPMLLAHYGVGQWCVDDLHAYARTAIGILRDPDAARRRPAGHAPVETRAITAIGVDTSPGAVLHAYWHARAGAAGERP